VVVGVADTAGGHADRDLIFAGVVPLHLLDDERLVESVDDCSPRDHFASPQSGWLDRTAETVETCYTY